MTRLRAWLVILMLPLFLAAQHCALLHQVGHLFNGVSVGQAQGDEGNRGVDGSFCDYHVAFAELLSAIDSGKAPPALASNESERGIVRALLPSPPGFIQPTSRGPPVLL